MSIVLTLRNFKKYTKARFEFLTGTTFISGAGRAGKTTIFKSISWCLYKMGKDISPWDNTTAKTVVKLIIESMNLSITRSKNPNAFKVIHKEDTYEDETAQAYIINLFGTYDVWRASCYLSGKKNRILSLPDKARSKLLEELFLSATPEELIGKIGHKISELESEKNTLLHDIDLRKRKILRKFANLDTVQPGEGEPDQIEAALKVKSKQLKKLHIKLEADDKIINTRVRLAEELKNIELQVLQPINIEELQQKFDNLVELKTELDLLNKIASIDKRLEQLSISEQFDQEHDLVKQLSNLKNDLVNYTTAKRDVEIWTLRQNLEDKLAAITVQNQSELIEKYSTAKIKQKQFELYSAHTAAKNKYDALLSQYDLNPELIESAIASKKYQEQLQSLNEKLGSHNIDTVLEDESEYFRYIEATTGLKKLNLSLDDIATQQQYINNNNLYNKYVGLYNDIIAAKVNEQTILSEECVRLENAIASKDTYQCPCCTATLKIIDSKLVNVKLSSFVDTTENITKLQSRLVLLRKIVASGVPVSTVMTACAKQIKPKLTQEQVNRWSNIKVFSYESSIFEAAKRLKQLKPVPLIETKHSISQLEQFAKSYRTVSRELKVFADKEIIQVDDQSAILTELKRLIKSNHERMLEQKSLQNQLVALPTVNNIKQDDYDILISNTQSNIKAIEQRLQTIESNRVKYQKQQALKSEKMILQKRLKGLEPQDPVVVEDQIRRLEKKITAARTNNAKHKIMTERAASIKIELSRLVVENIREQYESLQKSIVKLESKLAAVQTWIKKDAYKKETSKLEQKVASIIEDIGEYKIIAEIATTSKREIVEANLANVNNCLNDISSVFMENPVRVSLSMFYKTIKSEIRNKVTVEAEYNGELRNIKALCGTEKSTISVILTAALSKTNSFPMLLVDEYIAKCDLEVRDNIVAHICHILPKKAVLLAYHGGSLGEFDHTLQIK